ncbi:DUF4259 domain-containing protein [Embleya scabrispora]|uniref:DUF4259 domain-containing protein n=1 Tax=Embleya scabrispora TaxID=159449 RepID=UPI000373C104|nr:DUF4259 domain-containing protein [Embleya scabrispora]MYS79152.1 DUF4259 domain-containing protein [Streptomyces sp. SID5474]
MTQGEEIVGIDDQSRGVTRQDRGITADALPWHRFPHLVGDALARLRVVDDPVLDEALPTFRDDLRVLAVDALDRVVAEDPEFAALWDETPDGPKWPAGIRRLRAVLAPRFEPGSAAALRHHHNVRRGEGVRARQSPMPLVWGSWRAGVLPVWVPRFEGRAVRECVRSERDAGEKMSVTQVEHVDPGFVRGDHGCRGPPGHE